MLSAVCHPSKKWIEEVHFIYGPKDWGQGVKQKKTEIAKLPKLILRSTFNLFSY